MKNPILQDVLEKIEQVYGNIDDEINEDYEQDI